MFNFGICTLDGVLIIIDFLLNTEMHYCLSEVIKEEIHQERRSKKPLGTPILHQTYHKNLDYRDIQQKVVQHHTTICLLFGVTFESLQEGQFGTCKDLVKSSLSAVQKQLRLAVTGSASNVMMTLVGWLGRQAG